MDPNTEKPEKRRSARLRETKLKDGGEDGVTTPSEPQSSRTPPKPSPIKVKNSISPGVSPKSSSLRGEATSSSPEFKKSNLAPRTTNDPSAIRCPLGGCGLLFNLVKYHDHCSEHHASETEAVLQATATELNTPFLGKLARKQLARIVKCGCGKILRSANGRHKCAAKSDASPPVQPESPIEVVTDPTAKSPQCLKEMNPWLLQLSIEDLVAPPKGSTTFDEIPHDAVIGWTEAFNLTLACLAHDKDFGLRVLHLLPLVILQKPKRVRNSIPKLLNGRLKRFANGEWQELWKDFLAMRVRNEHDSITAGMDNYARAVKFAQRGELSRAMQALTAGKVAPATEATKAKLQEKHPKASAPIGLSLDDVTTPADLFSYANFCAVLRSLPSGSACGNSGLRYEHLRALINTSAEPALYAFCKEVSTSAAIPTEWRPWFFAGKLIALEKGANDVRPIAMGEVLMKLVGKAICEGQREKMAELMKGHQYGVAFPGGTEFIHHLLQWCLNKDLRQVLLSLDFSNAFNSVSRHAIAIALQRHFPQLLPWFLQMHGESPHLVFRLDNGSVTLLTSDEGCLQGDPLAPFYFALAILGPLKGLKSLAISLQKDAECLGYLDDVNSVTHGEHVRALYEYAEREFQTICGLRLNPKKCTILVRPETKSRLDSEYPSWVPEGVEVVTSGVRLLGAPLGSDEFTQLSKKS